MFDSDNKLGFTLVELLVVIILVAVLVAVALPRYMDAVYRGKVTACRANIQDINTAAMAYETKYYGDLTKLSLLAGEVNNSHILVTANFLDVAEECPLTHTYYQLKAVTVGNYTIGYKVDASLHFVDGDWKHGAHL